MKIHYGNLLDRYSDCRLTVQTDRGCIETVTVRPEDRDEAGALWGGGTVAYRCAGRHRIYVPRAERQ